MTRIDFYLLEDVQLIAAARFACRLAQKAVQGGRHVYLHADDPAHASELDDLLWEYPRNRFLPHEVRTEPPAAELTLQAPQQNGEAVSLSSPTEAPVVIGYGQAPIGDEVLINLASQIPDFFGRYERVAEIIVEERREEGRERYKFYRDCGYPLYHHELSNWEDA